MNTYNLADIKKNKNMRMRSVDGTFYLFGNGQCFELNELGALTWKYIDNDMSTEEFCEKVAVKYKENDLNKIQNDVNEFVVFLKDNGLVDINE